MLSTRPLKTSNKKSRPIKTRSNKRSPGKETLIVLLQIANENNKAPKINSVTDNGLYLVNLYNDYRNINDIDFKNLLKTIIEKFYNKYTKNLIIQKLLLQYNQLSLPYIPPPSPPPLDLEFESEPSKKQFKKSKIIQQLAAREQMPDDTKNKRNLEMELKKLLKTTDLYIGPK